MGEAEDKPHFLLSAIKPNETGWGPVDLPEAYKDLPFQLFNKGDRIGKIADWTGTLYADKRFASRYGQQYSQQTGSQYAYVHEEEEIGFQLVDTSKTQKTAQQKANLMRQIALQRKIAQREREKQRTQQGIVPPRGSRAMEKDRQRQLKRWQKQFGQRQRYDQRGQVQIKLRTPSILVKPDWEVLEEMDFPRLQRLNLPNVKDGEDIVRCGVMEYYDKTYDRCSTRNEKPLQRVHRVFHLVTTTDDPVIEELAKTPEYQVFATDMILATLMCSTRSVYSWDVIVHRIGNKIFFDKRDKTEIDYLTVSETAQEPPQDDDRSINSSKNLALEATFINRNFSQQVLKMSDEDKVRFERPNPFLDEGTNPNDLASVGYRYRKWDLGKGIILVARCEHDGVAIGPNGETQFLSIKAFNEWDSSYSGGIDWRAKIDSQRGAVLATELRNNSCKLAKWTVQAILASSDQLKFGYVSRAHVRDSAKHVILGTQQFKPGEFASQITLSMENGWGILRCIIDLCMKQPVGKYLIMKDPNKPVIRLYRMSTDLEEDEASEESNDDQ